MGRECGPRRLRDVSASQVPPAIEGRLYKVQIFVTAGPGLETAEVLRVKSTIREGIG
jgi:hypothetical protein